MSLNQCERVISAEFAVAFWESDGKYSAVAAQRRHYCHQSSESARLPVLEVQSLLEAFARLRPARMRDIVRNSLGLLRRLAQMEDLRRLAQHLILLLRCRQFR